MKRALAIVGVLMLVLGLTYAVGPAPETPVFDAVLPEVPTDVTRLDSFVQAREAAYPVRPDNQARIVWADSNRKGYTDVAFVYLHGLTATQREGDPVHRHLSRYFGANLYLARLAEHGLVTDSPLVHLTPERHYASAREALAIGNRLGKQVVLVSTSTGGTLALKLAADFPSVIRAVVLYSPCIAIKDPAAVALDRPWGKQIAEAVTGSEWLGWQQDSVANLYWYRRYHVNGAISLQGLIHHTMTDETFEQVKQPVYMAYYYKDEANQDNIVSVPAMLNMFEKLGTPPAQRRKQAFAEAGNHVIASDIKTQDWTAVQAGTINFLEDVAGLKKAQPPMYRKQRVRIAQR